jgi:hypothetical protein
MTYGLTPEGWNPKPYNKILESITENLRTAFGSGVETTVDSIIMQIVDPIALEIAEPWQGMSLIYDNMNPNASEGVGLDNVGAITNTPRLSGAKSTVIVQATGTEGAIIPANFQRGVETTNKLFETLQQFVLPAVGLQPFEFSMSSLDDGEVQATAGTLNQGSLPSGVTTMVNAVDAVLGSLDETDEEYRVGRKERLSAFGAGTVPAIKASLLSLISSPPITSVAVFENDTDITDVAFSPALPPHSIRALVGGGADQDIIDTLGIKKGAGTYTDGTVSGTYTDPTDGQTFPIRFSRPVDVLMYVDVVVASKDSNYPATGDQDIKNAILDLMWDGGEDIVLPKLQSAVTSIPGIIEYTLFFGKTASPTTDTTVVIAPSEQALFDSTRTNVSS